MTVLTYSEDPVAAAKVAEDFAKENEKFEILGGAMGENALDRAGVTAVSKCHPATSLLLRSWLHGRTCFNIAGAHWRTCSNIAASCPLSRTRRLLKQLDLACGNSARWNTLMKRKESKWLI